MQALLSFEKAPPLAAPLRFFLTAPLFAMLAGLLLLVEGPALLASRWSPAALAATHLLTLGFMLQIMLGALIQILPVVAGANLERPLGVARLVHLGLTLGTLMLAAGFYFSQPELLLVAVPVLVTTAAVFLWASGRALLGVPSTSPTIRGLKLALPGLAVAVGLGVLLAVALARGLPLALPALVDLHAGWGLGGWAGVLLAAMAYVVVPMFQLTPGYPARPSWYFPPAVLGLLLLWTAGVVLDVSAMQRLAMGGLALAGIVFSGLTLRLQNQRRRARSDATYRYWQLGLAATIFALCMLSTASVWPLLAEFAGWSLFFAVILLVGGFMSFIVGMLYKIVPFLSWLHLQNCGQARVPAPAMNKILSEAAMQRQMLAHGASFALLLAGVLWPDWLARPAGLGFVLANGWLLANLLGAMRNYRRHAAEIAAKLAVL